MLSCNLLGKTSIKRRQLRSLSLQMPWFSESYNLYQRSFNEANPQTKDEQYSVTHKHTELTFCQTLCMLLVASQEMACFHWLTRGGNRSKCNHFQHTDPGFLLDTCQNMSEILILHWMGSIQECQHKYWQQFLFSWCFLALTWATCDGPVGVGVASCRH